MTITNNTSTSFDPYAAMDDLGHVPTKAFTASLAIQAPLGQQAPAISTSTNSASPTNGLVEQFKASCSGATADWRQFIEDNDIGSGIEHQEIRKAISAHPSASRNAVDEAVYHLALFGFCPRDKTELVDATIKKFGNVKVKFNSIVEGTIGGRPIANVKQLSNHLKVAMSSSNLSIPSELFSPAFESWYETEREMIPARFLNELKFDATIDAAAAWKWVANEFNCNVHSEAYVIGVLKKFIWQVKRKMGGQEISHHLMPVLFGPQGTGKSRFVKNVIIGNMAELAKESDFKKIQEERDAEQWTYPIHFMDEMAYSSLAQADAVKNKITADSVSYRPMGTNTASAVTNSSTFIGCSNKADLSDLIRDPTGNRRFAPLYFSAVIGDNRQAAPFDISILWKSVDENGPDPSISVMIEIKALQAEQKFKTPIEQFVDDKFAEIRTTTRIAASELWNEYDMWKATTNTSCQLNKAAFHKEMQRISENNKHLTNIKPGNVSKYVFQVVADVETASADVIDLSGTPLPKTPIAKVTGSTYTDKRLNPSKLLRDKFNAQPSKGTLQ